MRMSYQTDDQLAYQDTNAEPKPPVKEPPSPGARRITGGIATLLTMATVLAIPYLLIQDFARVRKATGARAMTAQELEGTSRVALASVEGVMRKAVHTGAYVAGWAKLVARNLADFEDAVALLKTPYDSRHQSTVENRRRQGAQELVALLERNGLLQVMGQGISRDALAYHVGKVLNIEPNSVSRSFREAQEAQIGAIRSALDRHFSDLPGPSDLSVFSGSEKAEKNPTTASAKH